MKRILLVVALVVVVGGGLLFLRGRNGQSQATNLSQVVTVERRTIRATISATGEVRARRQAELAFDVNRLPLVELAVEPGQPVRAGQVLARIDPASLQRAVDQAEADLLTAQDRLEQAQHPYDESDRTEAEQRVAQAKVALKEARANLKDLQNPDLAEAQRAVRDATRKLQQARDDLRALQNDPATAQRIADLQWKANVAEVEHGKLLEPADESEILQDKRRLAYNEMMAAKDRLEVTKAQADLDLVKAQHRVAQAETELADARQTLNELQDGPDPTELVKARNQEAQAQLDLVKAQEHLVSVLAGPDPQDLQLAQARYDAAKAALEDAQADLEAATLTAPFDGTVIDVGAQVGDLVSASTVVVTLADLADLEILAGIDETDISQVEVGQPVAITFDAFPGRGLQGEVESVPLQGRLSQNVLTYEVPVAFGAGDTPRRAEALAEPFDRLRAGSFGELRAGSAEGLKPGMTANLQIEVGEKADVLAVPAVAVQRGEQGNVVLVAGQPGSAPAPTRVEVGLSDGAYTEIVQGLQAGDRVVVQYEAPAEGPGFFRFGGGPGRSFRD